MRKSIFILLVISIVLAAVSIFLPSKYNHLMAIGSNTVAARLNASSSLEIQPAMETETSPLDIQAYSISEPLTNEQWAIQSMHTAQLWSLTTGSPDILVAILDTGIDAGHEDLSGQVIDEVNFTDSPTASDIFGHGTHIAGIIAAKINGVGIAGIAPSARLLNVKVADDSGHCDINNLVKGIFWATDRGADIINISIEMKDTSLELEKAIDYAWERGVLIVAAAGNNSGKYTVYPAFYERALAVTALKEDNSLSPLSNYANNVDVAAPGYQIFSTLPCNKYGYETGTSFAAANVSGMAALLFGLVIDTNGDGWLNDEVYRLIISTSLPTDAGGTIWGKIDAAQIAEQLAK